MPRFAYLLMLVLSCVPAIAAADAVLDLPHRGRAIVLDGHLDDWRGDRLEIKLTEPEVPPPLANTGTFYLVWDAHHLWFAADIHDAEVFAAPADVAGPALYQWDSVELYVDGRGDRAERMDEDDFQLIVSCDGRHAVLQGDPLLRSVSSWQVPKREQQTVAVRAAARRTADGFVVEAAFPLAAAGIAEAGTGRMLAIDVGWNDWIEDHPRLPELLWDLENLALLIGQDTVSEVSIVDPDSLGWDGLIAWEARAYRPWSWRNGRDFGHPAAWQQVRLVGGPRLGEHLLGDWGLPRLFAASLTLVLGLVLVGNLGLSRRYRRRIGELLARIEELSQRLPGVPDPVPVAGPPLPDAPPDTATRLLEHVQANLGATMPVGEIAATLGVSLRTLQRECRRVLGASPREVILAVKMQAARDMLATGRWRVGEVAELVGFDSPYHFSRRFKDFHGQPPSSVMPTAGEPT